MTPSQGMTPRGKELIKFCDLNGKKLNFAGEMVKKGKFKIECDRLHVFVCKRLKMVI